jgi:leucyl-tRNA synthetase
LPENIKFTTKRNPLINYKPFIDTICPRCGDKAKRETDTMDTFVNSSWYFFRYCDPKNKKEIFNRKKAKYWMPIDLYIGGAEHACMHLIYFRFYTKFLRDLGLTDLDEPAYNLFNQGMIHGEDGAVMSKSRGNVVDPLDMVNKYSADTLRIFLVSLASPESDYSWNSAGIESMHKTIKKIIDFFQTIKIGKSSKKAESKINKAVKEITSHIVGLKYNLAVIKIRELFEDLGSENEISKKDIGTFLKMLSPFTPHIAEEIWNKLGNKTFISLESWPVVEESKIDENLEKQEKAIENLINDVNNVLKIVGKKKKVFIYTIPKEKKIYEEAISLIDKKTNLEVSVFSVSDREKYDPQNKSKKAKSQKPAIYLE